MTDFLTRLAERTLATRPFIRPDLPPSFGPATYQVEPKPPVEWEASEDAPRSSSMPLQGVAAHSAAAQPPVGLSAAAQGRGGESRHRQAAGTPVHASQAPSAPASGMEAGGQVSNAPPAGYSNLLQRRQPSSAADASAPATRVVVSSPVQAAAQPSVPAESGLRQARQEPPAIHVTIGTVEVRAVMPPPAPVQRPPERKAAPGLSLEEYLRERNGRRR